jgi:hypothetical protein
MRKPVTETLPLTITMHDTPIDLAVTLTYYPFNSDFDGIAQRDMQIAIRTVSILSECKLEWLHESGDLWYSVIKRQMREDYDLAERYQNFLLDNEILD